MQSGKNNMPAKSNRPKSSGPDEAQTEGILKKLRAQLSLLEPRNVFIVCCTSHILAAIFSPIQDCDEVYNYWEPTHYLNHGYGMQTWEYSPQYAIRSWLYSAVHAVPIFLASWLPGFKNKSVEFFFMRAVLAVICAYCETRLFKILLRSMNPRVAVCYLFVVASSTGMFHAATAYLPSSFAMYSVTLALAAFMDWRGGARTAQGLMWLGIGTIIGWPFVAVLSFPFIFEDLALGYVGDALSETFSRLVDGLVRCLIVLALEVVVDRFFYRILTCVPFNIVWYNIFSGSDRGPDIYGTEPWHFYIRNLLLNFHLWFPLACLALPLTIYHYRIERRPAMRFTFFRTMIFISPFYIWLTIFSLQPHKEERFMYPIYPCLALNSAISLHVLIHIAFKQNTKTVLDRIPMQGKVACVMGFAFFCVNLGIWHSVGLSTAYAAPLQIYRSLHHPSFDGSAVANVCLGKEWYRFPSSYHLPNSARLKFVRSDFHGLLPGAFSEAAVGFGLFPGAWLEPSGMNDRNIEDPAKYTPLEHCDYLVDSHFPSGEGKSPMEPDYALDGEKWERVECLPFLDTARTGLLARQFWVPKTLEAWLPRGMRRVWGEYCLLKRRR